LLDLPKDLIGVLMGHLPYQDMLALVLTCKQFYALMESTVVWQRKFQDMFPFDAKPKEFTRQSIISRYK
jgi:hypothetical protein